MFPTLRLAGANSQEQYYRPTDIEIIIQQDPGSLSSGLAELGNNESARNILVLSPLSLYPPGTQQVK